MPYIPKKDRIDGIKDCCDSYYNVRLSEAVELIQEHLQSLPNNKREGTANYIITRIVAGGLKPEGGWRYMWLNRAYGTFLSAAAEFQRRLVSPYEDKCIMKSGDIPEYENP